MLYQEAILRNVRHLGVTALIFLTDYESLSICSHNFTIKQPELTKKILEIMSIECKTEAVME